MTRLTTQFEGHVKVGAFSQPYQQFGTNGTFNGSNVSASPTSKASYTPGWWDNTATSNGDTYLRDAAGNKVFSGHVNTGARQYTLAQQ